MAEPTGNRPRWPECRPGCQDTEGPQRPGHGPQGQATGPQGPEPECRPQGPEARPGEAQGEWTRRWSEEPTARTPEQSDERRHRPESPTAQPSEQSEGRHQRHGHRPGRWRRDSSRRSGGSHGEHTEPTGTELVWGPDCHYQFSMVAELVTGGEQSPQVISSGGRNTGVGAMD